MSQLTTEFRIFYLIKSRKPAPELQFKINSGSFWCESPHTGMTCSDMQYAGQVLNSS